MRLLTWQFWWAIFLPKTARLPYPTPSTHLTVLCATSLCSQEWIGHERTLFCCFDNEEDVKKRGRCGACKHTDKRVWKMFPTMATQIGQLYQTTRIVGMAIKEKKWSWNLELPPGLEPENPWLEGCDASPCATKEPWPCTVFGVEKHTTYTFKVAIIVTLIYLNLLYKLLWNSCICHGENINLLNI